LTPSPRNDNGVWGDETQKVKGPKKGKSMTQLKKELTKKPVKKREKSERQFKLRRTGQEGKVVNARGFGKTEGM